MSMKSLTFIKMREKLCKTAIQYLAHLKHSKLAISMAMAICLEVGVSVSSMQMLSPCSSCYTPRSGKHDYTELGTNGGWSCKLADNFGLDKGGTNELFRVTEQGSDRMKAVFKED